MIGPVSFRGVGTSQTFQDIINKPQTYAAPQTTVAATGLNKSSKKKGSAAKAIVGIVAAAAAAVGGMIYISKHPQKITEAIGKLKDGRFKEILTSAKDKVVKWGGVIDEKVYKPVATKVSSLIQSVKDKFAKTSNPPA